MAGRIIPVIPESMKDEASAPESPLVDLLTDEFTQHDLEIMEMMLGAEGCPVVELRIPDRVTKKLFQKKVQLYDMRRARLEYLGYGIFRQLMWATLNLDRVTMPIYGEGKLKPKTGYIRDAALATLTIASGDGNMVMPLAWPGDKTGVHRPFKEAQFPIHAMTSHAPWDQYEVHQRIHRIWTPALLTKIRTMYKRDDIK